MKRIIALISLLGSLSVLFLGAEGEIAEPTTITTTIELITETSTATAWWEATTAPRYYYEIPRVCLWHGDITIEYGQAFDFIEYMPFDRYYSSTIEIWGEEETTFATDYDGYFEGAFNSCYHVILAVSPDHFIITNWNPEPLTISEINMFVW